MLMLVLPCWVRQFLLSERLANPAYFVLAGAEHGQAEAHPKQALRIFVPQFHDPSKVG